MIYDFDKFSSGDFIIFPNNDLWQCAALYIAGIKSCGIMHLGLNDLKVEH